MFNKKKQKYYVEVVRIWEFHSYDTFKLCSTYSHPMFIIKRRKLFGKDEIIQTFYYTSTIEEALDKVRELNGSDYVDNETAIGMFGTEVHWSENHDSGTYIAETYIKDKHIV